MSNDDKAKKIPLTPEQRARALENIRQLEEGNRKLEEQSRRWSEVPASVSAVLKVMELAKDGLAEYRQALENGDNSEGEP